MIQKVILFALTATLVIAQNSSDSCISKYFDPVGNETLGTPIVNKLL